MTRMKLVAMTAAAAAFVGGPLGAAPAHAQCEVFADPYDYPCGVAVETVGFAQQQAGKAIGFVNDVYDEAGKIVFTVACILFPPQCP